MKKIMYCMMVFALAMIPTAQARHHRDRGPSKDMRNAYDIMNIIGMGVDIIKSLGTTEVVVTQQPVVPVVTPVPAPVTVPSYVVANPPVVVQPYVTPAYNPYYPTPTYRPPRHYNRGNRHHHGGGHRRGRR